MVVYTEKAQEFKEIAEYCLEKVRYNSAANRFYYCLFIQAKGILLRNNFDYNDFLMNSPRLQDWQRRRNHFSHDTIGIALTEFLFSWDSSFNKSARKDFIKRWKAIYSLRLQADYSEKHISEKNINDCRNNFQHLWERMNYE